MSTSANANSKLQKTELDNLLTKLQMLCSIYTDMGLRIEILNLKTS